MRVRTHLLTVLLATVVFDIALVRESFAQRQALSSQTTLQLLDELGPRLGSEERSARLDALFNELGFYNESTKDSPSMGYILIYCGKRCRYGEIEAHIRGLELKIHTRGVPRDRLRIIGAGYRESQTVELWIASDGNAAPVPRSTLNIKQVTFTKTTKHIVENYDCCDDNGYLWKTFKP